MVGQKGKAGRKRKFNDPFHREMRKFMLDYYYKNREKRLAYNREYHKRIKDYSIKHKISFEEARKILGKSEKK